MNIHHLATLLHPKQRNSPVRLSFSAIFTARVREIGKYDPNEPPKPKLGPRKKTRSTFQALLDLLSEENGQGHGSRAGQQLRVLVAQVQTPFQVVEIVDVFLVLSAGEGVVDDAPPLVSNFRPAHVGRELLPAALHGVVLTRRRLNDAASPGLHRSTTPPPSDAADIDAGAAPLDEQKKIGSRATRGVYFGRLPRE